jgi:nucleoside-diphosphate-sugar epimerase
MDILLTGSSGFIGSRWLQSGLVRGRVFTLGRRPLETVPSGIEAVHVPCDLSRPGELDGLIRGGALPRRIDAVLHLAVSRLHRQFPESAGDIFAVNAAAAALLLDYARRAGAQHVLLGSTGSVYDPAAGGASCEDEFRAPRSYFATTKLLADTLASFYRGIVPVTVLRFFVPYGPGQPDDRLIAGLVATIRDGRPVTLPPAGDGMRLAPLYVDDAVAVLDQALREQWNETVNVATAPAISLRVAAATIAEALGRELRIVRSAESPDLNLAPDLGRLRARLAGREPVSFAVGIRRTIAHHASGGAH